MHIPIRVKWACYKLRKWKVQCLVVGVCVCLEEVSSIGNGKWHVWEISYWVANILAASKTFGKMDGQKSVRNMRVRQENSIHQKPSEGRNVWQTKYYTVLLLPLVLSSIDVPVQFEKRRRNHQHNVSTLPLYVKSVIGMKSTRIGSRTPKERQPAHFQLAILSNSLASWCVTFAA